MPISLSGSLNLSGSLTTTGTITATTLVVQTITSSISSITGSTNFGSLSSNTHTFTGSINASGSGNFSGSLTATDLIISDTYANDPLIKLVTTTSGNVEVQMRTATTTYNAGIGVVTSGYDFSLFTNNTTRLFISASGNVGIGTTAPSFSLDVYAPVNNQGIRINSAQAAVLYLYSTYNTANNRNWGMYTNSNVFGDFDIRQSNAKDGDMTSGGNGTSRLYIKNDGNVGIGTTNPGEKFVVQTTANNWTGNFVGNTTSGQSLGLLITAGTTSADAAFYIQDSSGSFNSFKVRGDGWLVSPTTYNNTSGVSANVGIDSAGNIFRATSSSKYKKDIKPYNKGLDTVLLMNPIYYKSKSEFDGDKQFAGFIAEEINTLGLNEFVQYNDENNEPEGLNYGNMTALLVKAIQELTARVQYLENK